MYMDPIEADLVQRFQRGDYEAASVLIKKYTKVIVGLVYSNVGRIQEAEDLVQDVFLETQKSVRHLRNPDRFASWLYKITQRVCNRWVRESRRAPGRLEEPEEVVETSQEPNEGEIKAEEVRRVVDGMPRSFREVVYMRYFQNLTYERMGALLDISPSAVNARLMKARKLLRNRIGAMKDTETS